MSKTTEGWIISICSVALIATGIFVGIYDERKAMQRQALAHGAAYWQVNPDGSTEFKWKEAGK